MKRSFLNINPLKIISNKKKSILAWILGGIFIRLLVMPFSIHPDLLYIIYFPYHFATKGVWDIYFYYKDIFEITGFSYYPPLCYFVFGFYLYLIKPILPGLNCLMEGFKKVLFSGGGHIAHYLIAGENSYIYRQIFMFKLPYLIIDIALVCLLLKLIQNPMQNKKIALLWAFNPVIFYVTYLFGQFDILPTFLIALALYWGNKGHKYKALFSVGLATALKNYPIILIPLFTVVLAKNLSNRLKLLAMGFFPYLSILAPLYFTSNGAVLSIFYSHNLAHKFCFPANFLSYLRLGLMAIAYFAVLFRSNSPNQEGNNNNLLNGILLILLLFYIFLFFNFQYFIWITPFILLKAGKDNFTLKTYALMVASLAIFKIVNKSMWAGLLAPLNPEFFMSLPSLDSIINRFLPFKWAGSGAYFIFLISAVFLWIKTFRRAPRPKRP